MAPSAVFLFCGNRLPLVHRYAYQIYVFIYYTQYTVCRYYMYCMYEAENNASASLNAVVIYLRIKRILGICCTLLENLYDDANASMQLNLQQFPSTVHYLTQLYVI